MGEWLAVDDGRENRRPARVGEDGLDHEEVQ